MVSEHIQFSWSLGALARASRATSSGEGLLATVTAVSTDSRSLPPGALFVALRGDRFDGHQFVEKVMVPDNVFQIRAVVSRWIADPDVQVVLMTGGTGVTGFDGTPEAVKPLFEKELDGFGEIFRSISFDEIGTSSLQSRAVAGVANGTYLFSLPGSSGACATAWDKLLVHQLDYRTRPCNLVELMPRLLEHRQ